MNALATGHFLSRAEDIPIQLELRRPLNQLSSLYSHMNTSTAAVTRFQSDFYLCLSVCILCVFCFILHMCCIIVSTVGWT